MALNATVEPILIKERRHVIIKVSTTALRGMFQPGLTCEEEKISAYAKSMAHNDGRGKEDDATS